MDPFDSNLSERASLPRNMIENSMFQEEPDVVDLAPDAPAFPAFPTLDPHEARGSRLLVRGLAEAEPDEDGEDGEEGQSSARLLGVSFMNRSAGRRAGASPYGRQAPPTSCWRPSTRTLVVGVLFLIILTSMTMVLYFLPGCTFTKAGCQEENSTTGGTFPWTELRLPASVRPVRYDLTVNPDLHTMTFTGRTAITLSVVHRTKRIVLHAADLNITSATFQASGRASQNVTVLHHQVHQQIAVSFPEELQEQRGAVLTLYYSARLSNTYEGFYNSSYTDRHGRKRVLAATQFEPLAARKAFPCFDEPAFKATFRVRISHGEGYVALSNMPRARTTRLPGGLLLDEFEESSVNMSTYLVAFVVATFESVSRNISNTLVSVYSVPEKKENTLYALDTACTLLQYYNTYFDTDYPLSKLDLVAIPDFLAGAMENWGLITFRETSLLVHNGSSPLEKQLVASVVAHELAHQWFGNLVTMSWWNDLWLNEGFATFMQYTSLQKNFPWLDMEDRFLSVRLRALDKDALNASHAVSSRADSPEQVAEMFDSVSYEKGAAVLLMLQAWLPEDLFRKGIVEYLKKFSGSNTVTEDLWDSIAQADRSPQHPDIAAMMNTWTQQKGFPLVSVSREGDQVTLTQEPFLLHPEGNTHPASLWHVPVTYVSNLCSIKPDCVQVFTLRNRTATLRLRGDPRWVKLNAGGSGFYVVDYGVGGWADLIQALTSDPEVLPSQDRAALIHNMFSLSRLGRVSFRQVLNLLQYVVKETAPAPLCEFLTQLGALRGLLENRSELDLAAHLKAYVVGRLGPLMESQGWGEELSASRQELRSALLQTACSLDLPSCLEPASRLWSQHANGTASIPGDLRRVVFSVGARSEEGWAVLMEAYAATTHDGEKRDILRALSSTRDPRHLARILVEGLRGETVQTQDLPLILAAVSRGFAGPLLAWDFVQENWDRLLQKFPVGSYALQSIIQSTTSQFSTQTRLEQVRNFLASLGGRGSQMRSVQVALETIELNQRWMDANLPQLRRWL